MEMHKKKQRSVFSITASLLAAAVLILAGSLLWKQADEKRRFQFIADLGGMEYDEAFLKKAAQIQGICQVYPVLEIPVRLRIKDYTMDAVVTAVDMEVLDKQVQKAREVSQGNTPVLFLGKNSLAGMRDSNDHAISEDQQKKFLEDYDNLGAEYSVAFADSDEGKGKAVQWKDCIIAGIFAIPAEGIYLPYEQGSVLCGSSENQEIKKVLITVRGRENYEKAQAYFDNPGQS